jgi:hypothetical protein
MGCYIPVANDNFFARLKNLHAMVPFINYSNVEELVTGKKSDAPRKLGLSLAGLKKAKENLSVISNEVRNPLNNESRTEQSSSDSSLHSE